MTHVQTVYVVVGCPPEFTLYHIFSCRERAQAWIDKQWHPEDHLIWEVDVDDEVE